MLKALYFPHTEIQSPVIVKNGLLLWDRIETIVPRADWVPSRPFKDPQLREAVDLLVERRVPTDIERNEAHRSLSDLIRSGFLASLVQSSPTLWRRRDYLVHPEKFVDETWRMLNTVLKN